MKRFYDLTMCKTFSIAKYCNTNHFYGLAFKGDFMSPQNDGLFIAGYFVKAVTMSVLSTAYQSY